MSAAAFDTFMAPFDASSVSIFFMRSIGTTMRKIVIVAYPQVVLAHAAVPLKSVRHLDSV